MESRKLGPASLTMNTAETSAAKAAVTPDKNLQPRQGSQTTERPDTKQPDKISSSAVKEDLTPGCNNVPRRETVAEPASTSKPQEKPQEPQNKKAWASYSFNKLRELHKKNEEVETISYKNAISNLKSIRACLSITKEINSNIQVTFDKASIREYKSVGRPVNRGDELSSWAVLSALSDRVAKNLPAKQAAEVIRLLQSYPAEKRDGMNAADVLRLAEYILERTTVIVKITDDDTLRGPKAYALLEEICNSIKSAADTIGTQEFKLKLLGSQPNRYLRVDLDVYSRKEDPREEQKSEADAFIRKLVRAAFDGEPASMRESAEKITNDLAPIWPFGKILNSKSTVVLLNELQRLKTKSSPLSMSMSSEAERTANCSLIDGRIYTTATINGMSVLATLDSGAPPDQSFLKGLPLGIGSAIAARDIMIPRKIAKTLGLLDNLGRLPLPIDFPDKTRIGHQVTLKEFSLGPIKFTNKPAVVVDDLPISSYIDPKDAILLGAHDYFCFSSIDRKMKLTSAVDDNYKALDNLILKRGGVIAFESKVKPGQQFVAMAECGVGNKKMNLRLILDTGNPGGLTIFNTKAATTFADNFRSLSTCPVKLSDGVEAKVAFRVLDTEMSDVDGSLGIEFLEQFDYAYADGRFVIIGKRPWRAGPGVAAEGHHRHEGVRSRRAGPKNSSG